jgi:hypothetical protein
MRRKVWTAMVSDAPCNRCVSQSCASAPQLGRFRECFQARRATWLGREDSDFDMASRNRMLSPVQE